MSGVKIEEDIKLDFKDVLFRPQRNDIRSRANVDLVREYKFKHSPHQYRGLPIVASNMDTVGTFTMAKELTKHQLFTTIHKHYSVEDFKEFAKSAPEALDNVAFSCGMAGGDMEKLQKLVEAVPGIRAICLDVANGYSNHFVDYVKQVRSLCPSHIIMAGNVVTGEMVQVLLEAGADIVKVGIGPGSVCTTRRQTGVGYPQLSAVLECAEAAHAVGGHIMSDGGCTCPGDIAKAFGAGADFVMLGGMFAGHDESGGDIHVIDGKKVKIFYGMSSSTAMEKYAGGVADYRSSEGKTVTVTYRGPVGATVRDILGGIRSTCTYVGAHELGKLHSQTTFVRVTQQLNGFFSQ